jgi:hypothetical protein
MFFISYPMIWYKFQSFSGSRLRSLSKPAMMRPLEDRKKTGIMIGVVDYQLPEFVAISMRTLPRHR